MPTTAEHPSLNQKVFQPLQSPSYSWTDDLPVCDDTAVGFSCNQIYREDGFQSNKHEFEDKNIYFSPDENTCLYAVFDGHDGNLASHFAAQRLPAELLLGQLIDLCDDAKIKHTLGQAIEAVESGFLASIDDTLAEIANLQIQLPEGISTNDVYKQYPEVLNRLKLLNTEVSGGTTVVMCLIQGKKLYITNIGDSRALLVKKNPESNQLEVLQLSVDHNIRNEDEILRLSHLGADVEALKRYGHIGNQENTRCIGNYFVKSQFKHFDTFSSTTSEPVISEPDITGGIAIDDDCLFLLLMSGGFYKTLEAVIGTQETNTEIAKLVLEQFMNQSTLKDVAQEAVNKATKLHIDAFMRSRFQASSAFPNFREDITLLVRNLNMCLAGSELRPGGFTFNNQSELIKLPSREENIDSGNQDVDCDRTLSDEAHDSNLESGNSQPDKFNSQNLTSQLPLDESGKIIPYVDFSEYDAAVSKAKREGFDLFKGVEFVPGWKNTECQTILE